MAFCTKCGRELIPGQVCVCQRNYSGSNTAGQGTGNTVEGGMLQNTRAAQQDMGNTMRQNTGSVAQQGAGRTMSQNTVQQGAGRTMSQNVEQQGAGKTTFQNTGNTAQQDMGRTMSQNMGNMQQTMGQQNMQSAASVKAQSVSLVSNVIEVFLAVLKAPVSVGRKVVIEGRVAIGVSLIILQAVFTGLFGVIMISKINELIAGVAGSSSNSLVEYASAAVVKLSYIRGFMISVLGSVALSFLIALLAMLLLMLFRGKTTYTSMLLAAGIRCVGMMPVTVLAILVSILNIGWGIMIFMASAAVGFIFMGRVLTAGSVFEENKVPYVLFLLVILTIVVQYFMVLKIWPLYLPDVLRASYYDFLSETKGAGGLSGMFKDIFDY